MRFQHPQGWQRRDAGNILTHCSRHSALWYLLALTPRRKPRSCLLFEVALAEKFHLFFLHEVSWNLLRFEVPPNHQPHPSLNTHFPTRIFCLHHLGLHRPQVATGVLGVPVTSNNSPYVPKPRLSKCIYTTLQLQVILLNLIAKFIGWQQKGGGTGADAFALGGWMGW